ncbi:MAG TPA: hypothetical protein VM051_10485 [Usitatibacter sp.]|nr:hypothetical protein [Usitatibacter sp.]
MRDLLNYYIGFSLRKFLRSAFAACILLWTWYCLEVAETPRWGLLIFGVILAVIAYMIGVAFIKKVDDRDTI